MLGSRAGNRVGCENSWAMEGTDYATTQVGTRSRSRETRSGGKDTEGRSLKRRGAGLARVEKKRRSTGGRSAGSTSR